MAAFARLIAAPLVAQVRVGRNDNTADPDDVPEVTLAMMGGGVQLNTGPATVAWNPSNTVSGDYTLKGTFTLQEPNDHNNDSGRVFGAGALGDDSQNHMYFHTLPRRGMAARAYGIYGVRVGHRISGVLVEARSVSH
jgi:hypothetical protein